MLRSWGRRQKTRSNSKNIGERSGPSSGLGLALPLADIFCYLTRILPSSLHCGVWSQGRRRLHLRLVKKANSSLNSRLTGTGLLNWLKRPHEKRIIRMLCHGRRYMSLIYKMNDDSLPKNNRKLPQVSTYHL